MSKKADVMQQISICKGMTTLEGFCVAGCIGSSAFVEGLDLLLRLVCIFLGVSFLVAINRQYMTLSAEIKKKEISPKSRFGWIVGYIAVGLLLIVVMLLPFVPLVIKALFGGIYTALILRHPLRLFQFPTGVKEERHNTKKSHHRS